jgi:DNA polymerase III epsilon subunit family exonuclease
MKTGFFVFDVETTGLDCNDNEILSIAALILDERLQETKRLVVYAMPDKGVEPEAAKVNGYTQAKWLANGAVSQYTMVKEICRFVKDYVALIPLGHNVDFDIGFLKALFKRHNLERDYRKFFSYHRIDTVAMAVTFDLIKFGIKGPEYKLGALCQRFDIPLENAHDALCDVEATATLYKKIVDALGGKKEVRIVAPSKYKKFIEPGGEKGTWMFVRGKHEGQSLEKVAQEAPDYIQWVLKEVNGLSPEHLSILRESISRK